MRIGLGTKFALLASAIVLVTLGVNAYSTINVQSRKLNEQLLQRAELLGHFTSLISPEAILGYDLLSLDNNMREVSRQDDVVYGFIFDEKDNNLTTYINDKNGYIAEARQHENSSAPAVLLKYLSSKDNIVNMKFPIKQGDQVLGNVFIGVSKDSEIAAIKSMLYRQISNGILTSVILSFFIYILFRYSALRAINNLLTGYRFVTAGNLGNRLEVLAEDELGSLTKGFNEMSAQLQTSISEKDQALAQLNTLNLSLEKLVEDKTAELRRNETRLDAIIENISDAIVVIDERGYIESINRSAELIFQLGADVLLNLHSIFILSDRVDYIDPACDEYIDEVDGPFSLDKVNSPVEFEGRRNDGSYFPMEIVATPMVLDDREYRICLIRDITQRKETERQLEEAREKLVESAHKSGMAEMATGVLHNIGNILNSVNVSIEEVTRTVESSKIQGLHKANALLSEHLHDLGSFVSTDEKGRMLPQYYLKLGELLAKEQTAVSKELEYLQEKFCMMREVIRTQQEYAKAGIRIETFNLETIIDDGLRLQQAMLQRLNVTIENNVADIPPCLGHKSKLLQVITNVLKNAGEAMAEMPDGHERCLRINAVVSDKHVLVLISDTGCGILAENLARIFNHGFTTKKTGHGFGLHSSANAMTEMGGKLNVTSDGEGNGACFNIEIRLDESAARRGYKTINNGS